ncbi:MAG: hypothetical protein II442_07540 [Oscillospiraceae bacterium]|nr:hypothetical protein [Oscillospiraceae bacterium]
MLEVKRFPKDMSVFEVNRADAKQCFLSGLFEETVKLDSGAELLDLPEAGPPL